MVTEVLVEPASILEALVTIGGLLALIVNVKYLVGYFNLCSLNREMKAYYKK